MHTHTHTHIYIYTTVCRCGYTSVYANMVMSETCIYIHWHKHTRARTNTHIHNHYLSHMICTWLRTLDLFIWIDSIDITLIWHRLLDSSKLLKIHIRTQTIFSCRKLHFTNVTFIYIYIYLYFKGRSTLRINYWSMFNGSVDISYWWIILSCRLITKSIFRGFFQLLRCFCIWYAKNQIHLWV